MNSRICRFLISGMLVVSMMLAVQPEPTGIHAQTPGSSPPPAGTPAASRTALPPTAVPSATLPSQTPFDKSQLVFKAAPPAVQAAVDAMAREPVSQILQKHPVPPAPQLSEYLKGPLPACVAGERPPASPFPGVAGCKPVMHRAKVMTSASSWLPDDAAALEPPHAEVGADLETEPISSPIPPLATRPSFTDTEVHAAQAPDLLAMHNRSNTLGPVTEPRGGGTNGQSWTDSNLYQFPQYNGVSDNYGLLYLESVPASIGSADHWLASGRAWMPNTASGRAFAEWGWFWANDNVPQGCQSNRPQVFLNDGAGNFYCFEFFLDQFKGASTYPAFYSRSLNNGTWQFFYNDGSTWYGLDWCCFANKSSAFEIGLEGYSRTNASISVVFAGQYTTDPNYQTWVATTGQKITNPPMFTISAGSAFGVYNSGQLHRNSVVESSLTTSDGDCVDSGGARHCKLYFLDVSRFAGGTAILEGCPFQPYVRVWNPELTAIVSENWNGQCSSTTTSWTNSNGSFVDGIYMVQVTSHNTAGQLTGDFTLQGLAN
jgi:hypothetical protein